jgi:NADPH:quinone reductase-like Zn-dependent oxidoreductase
MLIAKHDSSDLERLAELVEGGELTAQIDSTYPLDRAPDAMRHLVAGHARGKVVITTANAD